MLIFISTLGGNLPPGWYCGGALGVETGCLLYLYLGRCVRVRQLRNLPKGLNLCRLLRGLDGGGIPKSHTRLVKGIDNTLSLGGSARANTPYHERYASLAPTYAERDNIAPLSKMLLMPMSRR